MRVEGAGADVAMMTSALLRHGPKHVGSLEAELRSVLAERHEQSVRQLRGAMSHGAMPDPGRLELVNHLRTVMSWSSRAPVSRGRTAGGEPAS